MATICLSAGHNKWTGARSINGDDEWTWNSRIIEAMTSILRCRGHKVVVLTRDKTLGYTSAMKKLGKQMREAKVDLSMELHFNASSREGAHGYEFLHWFGSSKGKKLALSVAKSFGEVFPNLSKRGKGGARSLWFHRWNEPKAYSGRGGAYTYLTPCPAIICEPCFATNYKDWSSLRNEIDAIARSYCDGIENYLSN